MKRSGRSRRIEFPITTHSLGRRHRLDAVGKDDHVTRLLLPVNDETAEPVPLDPRQRLTSKRSLRSLDACPGYKTETASRSRLVQAMRACEARAAEAAEREAAEASQREAEERLHRAAARRHPRESRPNHLRQRRVAKGETSAVCFGQALPRRATRRGHKTDTSETTSATPRDPRPATQSY